LCEKFLLNKEIEALSYTTGDLLFRQIKPALQRFDNIRALETYLVSHRLGIAGSVDCIAEVDGVLTVIDFKTSGKSKKAEWIEDYFIQAAFYFNAFFEMTKELPKQILILIAVEDGALQEFFIQGSDIIKYTKLLHSRKEAYDVNQANGHI
jgi:genome maintenance exonuclease 1